MVYAPEDFDLKAFDIKNSASVLQDMRLPAKYR